MFDSLFNLHFVVEHIYEILHLLALRFRIKLAIRFTQSSAIIATPTQGQKDTKGMKDIHLQK